MALSISSSKVIATLTLVFCLGLAALNHAAPNLAFERKSQESTFWEHKVHHQQPHSHDIVMLGDSRLYRGIDPASMQEILPHASILNFGFSSGGLNPEIYNIATNFINPNGQKAIILSVTPLTLTPTTLNNTHYHSIKSAQPTHPMAKNISIFFRRLDISAIKRHLQNSPVRHSRAQYSYFANGWIASDMSPPNPEHALRSYRTVFKNNQVDETLISALLQQTQHWVAQGITVYAFTPYVPPAMQEIETQTSGFNAPDFIKRFTAAGGQWLDIQGEYTSYDGSHLNSTSARRFSRALATQIKDHITSKTQ